VTGPSSAIARASSIAEYRHRPMAFHHIVGRRMQAARAPGDIQALAFAARRLQLGRSGKNP
jgi:hypothetical protein